MASNLEETIQTLEELRKSTDSILVAYSAGKDSLCVLDLCSRIFKRVEAFYMYLVPGLAFMEERLEFARKHWGVVIHQYPHWLLDRFLKQGTYCFEHRAMAKLPEWKLRDVYSLAVAETEISYIATGAKKADSLWRKRSLAAVAWNDIVYPIVNWSKLDVLAYLKMRNIPLPESSKGSATGVDLSQPSIVWLHDTYPEDFKKLLEVFPLAGAVIKRRPVRQGRKRS